MVNENNILPTRLRPVTDKSIGTTAFFRNRPLYDVLLDQLKLLGKDHYTLLFHACSIGAEVYSFLIQYFIRGHADNFSVTVYATDLEQDFVDFARNALYPLEITTGMTQEERAFFVQTPSGLAINPELRQAINFLDACSYLDFTTEQTFDVVFLLNTLVYVPEQQQRFTIDKIAQYNSKLLVTSAFHMSTIKSDLTRNHYQPVLAKQEEIHNAWTDRRVTVFSDELGPGIYANWRLPEFSEIEDFEYRYCALFFKLES